MRRLFSAMIVCLLIVLATAAAGCNMLPDNPLAAETTAIPTNTEPAGHPSTMPGAASQTISEYFKGKPVYFYCQTPSTLTPESGTCPEKTEIPPELHDEELFFDAGSEVYEDRIIAHISPVTSADMNSGCSKKSEYYRPEELTITEKDEDIIIASGTGRGRAEQTGSNCDNYAYTFETQETWIFSTQKLEDLVIMDVFTGAPQSVLPTVTTYVIDAPGWDNPPKTMEYSHFGLTITPVSDYDFRFLPEARLVRIEGHRLNTSVLKINAAEASNEGTKFNFAASFNADYVVVPVLKVLGKNGKVLREIAGTSEFIIRVTDSPQGDLPN